MRMMNSWFLCVVGLGRQCYQQCSTACVGSEVMCFVKRGTLRSLGLLVKVNGHFFAKSNYNNIEFVI